MLCDVKKLKKIGFFDEDFFLYWEDIDLIERINNSKFMIWKFATMLKNSMNIGT